jgi:hypothetical protein
MAQRQLSYNTLPAKERAIQDQWARAQLSENGFCVAGFRLVRKEKGYRCLGGNHCVTDALLAEGDGGFYQGDNGGVKCKPGEPEFWGGPYYMIRGGGGSVGGAWGYPPGMTGRGPLNGRELRAPRAAGIPNGMSIPGTVLGIGPLLDSDRPKLVYRR